MLKLSLKLVYIRLMSSKRVGGSRTSSTLTRLVFILDDYAFMNIASKLSHSKRKVLFAEPWELCKWQIEDMLKERIKQAKMDKPLQTVPYKYVRVFPAKIFFSCKQLLLSHGCQRKIFDSHRYGPLCPGNTRKSISGHLIWRVVVIALLS